MSGCCGRRGGYEVKLTKTVQTNDFENVAPVDEQMDELERRRLLYVAATRARDHLVVSLHRKGKRAGTNAEILADAGAANGRRRASGSPGDEARREPPADSPGRRSPGDGRLGRLASDRRAVRERFAATSAVSASGLEGTEPAVVLAADPRTAPAGAKGARDLELPPWSKGRYGTAIGRAVHGVLQAVDLATGAGTRRRACRPSASPRACRRTQDVVRGLVRSALRAPTSYDGPPPESTGASPTSGCGKTTAPCSRASST